MTGYTTPYIILSISKMYYITHIVKKSNKIEGQHCQLTIKIEESQKIHIQDYKIKVN